MLLTATISNHTEVVNYLLEKNVDVNASNLNGVTALIMAASDKKYIDIFKALLSHPNININTSKELEITSWITASTFDNKQAIELLIDYFYRTEDKETLEEWKNWAINNSSELTVNLIEEKEKEQNSKNISQSQESKKQASKNIPQSQESKKQASKNISQSQESKKQGSENISQSQESKKQASKNIPQSQESKKQDSENIPQSQESKKQAPEDCRSLWKTKP